MRVSFGLSWVELSGPLRPGNLHLLLLPFRTASVVGERFFFGPHWGVHIISLLFRPAVVRFFHAIHAILYYLIFQVSK